MRPRTLAARCVAIVSLVLLYLSLAHSRTSLPLRRKGLKHRKRGSTVCSPETPSAVRRPSPSWPRLEGLKSFAHEHRSRAARAGPQAVQAFIANIVNAQRHVNRSVSAAHRQTGRVLQSTWRRARGATASVATDAALSNFVSNVDAASLELLEQANGQGLEHVLSVINEPGWQFVTEKNGVTVHKKYIKPSISSSSSSSSSSDEVVNEQSAAKFACVIARGTLNAKAEDVYALFKSNDRVHEYNDNCADVR
jgi:hypothetical protein